MASLPPGVQGNSGLVLNDGQVKFMAALRRSVPASTPLYVTSGTRTAERQARALVAKRKLGDNLYKLYKADYIVRELMAAPNTVEDMAPIIQRWANKGVFMSRHMRGDALDLRSRNLSQPQIKVIMAKARALGAKAIYETKPPHIHVEGIGGTASNLKLAAQEATQHAIYALTPRARRRHRRQLQLYRQRKMLYTLGAVGFSALIVAGIGLTLYRRNRQ